MKSLPRGVWILGFVSMFMDISSEMIHSLLPILLVGSMGVSAAMLGLIEGLAEATAQVVKLYSGVLSDRLASRKILALVGYGLAAITKPLFPMAGSAATVLVARLVDRVGKGIRGAPRDAMVADFTPAELRGAAFGLRQSLDTVGAFIGPLIAVALLGCAVLDLRGVLWAACIPAFIAVAILAFVLSEPPRVTPLKTVELSMETARLLGAPFWRVALVAGMFSMARFSEAFLVLKASETGLATAYVPLVLVVMSIVYSASSYPAGALSDRTGRVGLLAAGLIILLVADVVLALSASPTGVFAGVALWGLHMGLTQGLLSALVADTAPAELRGTAFGVFNLANGIVALAASILAGLLWDRAGSWTTFAAGAAFAVATLLLLPLARSRPMAGR